MLTTPGFFFKEANLYREIGWKPSREHKNMKSDLLSLFLPDDRVGKVTHPCSFFTHKYDRTSGFFGL